MYILAHCCLLCFQSISNTIISLISPTPMTWIAIVPISFFQGKMMKYIHHILTIIRFIEHGAFIMLVFILDPSPEVYNFNGNYNIIEVLKLYVSISYFVVFALYFILHNSNAIINRPVSTNRSLGDLVQLQMWNEIQQMVKFGYKYSYSQWKTVNTVQLYSLRVYKTTVQDCTLLMFFAYNDMPDLIQNMIEAGINVNETPSPDSNSIAQSNAQHETPLFFAGCNGNDECLKLLIDAIYRSNSAGDGTRYEDLNVVINKPFKNYRNQTVVFFAARGGFTRCVELLIKAGANVNQRDNMGRTALYVACRQNHSECIDKLRQFGATWATPAIQRDIDIIKAFITAENVNEIDDEQGRTALIYAAEGIDECLMSSIESVEVLIANQADVNMMDNNGDTALICASRMGNYEIVSKLIGSDANVDIKNKDQHSALFYAMNVIDENYCKCATQLIDAGANLNVKNKDGMPVVVFLARNSCVEWIEKAIHMGQDVNQCDNDGNTALIWATMQYNILYNCKKNSDTSINTQLMETLITWNADVNIENNEGKTALFYATQNNSLKCVEILTAQGKSISLGYIKRDRPFG